MAGAALSLLSFAVALLAVTPGSFGGSQCPSWSGNASLEDIPSEVTARTEAEWTRLWRRIGAPPPAGFDPAATTAYAYFAGAKPTGGWRIRAVLGPRNAPVSWQVVPPVAGAIVTQAITHPWRVILVPIEGPPCHAP